MITYKDLLKKCNVISEEDFNKIIDSLPEFDDLESIPDLTDFDDVVLVFIEEILSRLFDYVYPDSIDFDNLELELGDVQSVEDLEEIKSTFSNWTITNYDECLEEIKEIEEDQAKDEKREGLLNYIRNHASIEDLENFANGL
jgi:hypothetical protein